MAAHVMQVDRVTRTCQFGYSTRNHVIVSRRCASSRVVPGQRRRTWMCVDRVTGDVSSVLSPVYAVCRTMAAYVDTHRYALSVTCSCISLTGRWRRHAWVLPAYNMRLVMSLQVDRVTRTCQFGSPDPEARLSLQVLRVITYHAWPVYVDVRR
jgi:hypothetical protein